MLVRFALFALMSIGLAGFAVVAWISMQSAATGPGGAQSPVSTTSKVLVAARSVRAGSLLKPEDVSVHEMPAARVPAGASQDTPDARTQLWGAMLRHSLSPGEPVLVGDVVHPGDHGFLAATLGPNMRAVTVGVDIISGSAGLIWPGDRVDLILTQSIDGPAVSSAHRFAAETVLSNVRVIAIDQQLVQGANPDVAEPKPARTVTLEVTGAQAERVAVAERLGRLSLVVRASDESGAPSQVTPGAAAATTAADTTWAGDVSPALNHTGSSTPNSMRVFLGASEGKDFRF